MHDLSFSGLVIVAAVAFGAPLMLGLLPSVRLPAVVIEILAGIMIGPAVLGWVEIDEPIRVLSLMGLAFLLFLAGLELELDRISSRVLRLTATGFAISFAIALAAGFLLDASGLGETPLLLAIMLSATALGVVIPVLKDAGESGSEFGQLVIAAASIADFITIVLLSLFFSGESASIWSQVILISGFALLVAVAGLTLARVHHSMPISAALLRLQDTTAQIRVRGAFLLLAGFVALAENLGLEVILGAFLAGALLTLIDRDEEMTHPQFRVKLEAIGFGVFVPFFFISSGINFNLDALFASASTVARVPVFLVALLAVRAVPAAVYAPLLGGRRTVAAGLLQATSLGFIVVASQIGMELGKLSEATGAAMIAAGLLSVLIFPFTALTLLRGAPNQPAVDEPVALRDSALTRGELAM